MFENINLVRSIAWMFHRKTGINWKELFSQACLAYCEAMNSHSPNKGKETTWIYHCLYHDLITFCQREKRFKTLEGIEDWYITTTDTFEELFQSNNTHFSNSTQEIIEMVRQDPPRYAIFPAQKAIGRIRQDLRDKKAWSWPKVEVGMRNLRLELVNNVPSPELSLQRSIANS